VIVKMGDQYFDSDEQPIMLILNSYEKDHVRNMGEQKQYCAFPSDYDIEKIKKWMKVPQELLDAVEYLE
jgi:hypothetical protein